MLYRWQQLRKAWTQRTATLTLSGALACLWIAFIAQRSLDEHKSQSLPLAMLGLAAFAFALLLCNTAPLSQR